MIFMKSRYFKQNVYLFIMLFYVLEMRGYGQILEIKKTKCGYPLKNGIDSTFQSNFLHTLDDGIKAASLALFSHNLNEQEDSKVDIKLQLIHFNSTSLQHLQHYDQEIINLDFLKSQLFDAYLVFNTPALQQAISKYNKHTNDGQFYVSNEIIPVYTTLLLTNSNQILATTGDDASKSVTGKYFINVFHSSVWSFILLSVILMSVQLYGFEYTYPFGYKLQGKWVSRISLIESFELVICALFLQNTRKTLVSPAARILVIFWYAFVVICITTFILGSGAIIFGANWWTQKPTPNALSVSTNLNRPFCLHPDCARLISCHNLNNYHTLLCQNGSFTCNAKYAFSKQENWRPYLAMCPNDMKIIKSDMPLSQMIDVPSSNIIISNSFEDAGLQSNDARQHTISVINKSFQMSIVFLVFDNLKLVTDLNQILTFMKFNGISEELENSVKSKSDRQFTSSHNTPYFHDTVMTMLTEEIFPMKFSAFWNPFVMMLFGMAIALLVLCAEFLYRTFVTKEYIEKNDEISE